MYGPQQVNIQVTEESWCWVCKHILSKCLQDCAVRWSLECGFFGCFVDTVSMLVCITQV